MIVTVDIMLNNIAIILVVDVVVVAMVFVVMFVLSST